jgi:phage terminase large subunit-like protein
MQHESAEPCHDPSGAWRTWLLIGATGFGGPAGQMAILQDPNGAVFAIGQFIEIDDPNEWPD